MSHYLGLVFVDGYPNGHYVPNKKFAADYAAARDENPDLWAIVVDVHN